MKYPLILLFVSVFVISQAWALEQPYNLKDHDGILTVTEMLMKYNVPYKISNAKINDSNLDCDSASFVLSISPSDEGVLKMDVPIKMMGSIYMVLVNEKEWDKVSISGNVVTVNFPANTTKIDIRSAYYITQTEEDGVCDVSHNPPYAYIQSPLKQFRSGISVVDIKCNENLVLVQKHDSSPACVTESTKEKLIERGWAKPN